MARGKGVADPISAAIRMNLGRMYLDAHQPDEAIRHLRDLRDALELNPEFRPANQELGFAYLQKRMPTEAVAAFADRGAGRLSDSTQLAYAYGVTGCGLGDHDAGFRWLEQEYREHAARLNLVKVLPAFEPLHADSRWAPLLRRMRAGAVSGPRRARDRVPQRGVTPYYACRTGRTESRSARVGTSVDVRESSRRTRRGLRRM